MKESITLKIGQISSKITPLSESEVAYLMILVRKYLEYTETQNYFVLKFFCDWSLHIVIDRSLPAMELLQKINVIINELKNVPNSELLDKITEIVSFQKLKTEFDNFFQHSDIPKEIISNEKLWNNFVEKYIEIILDCPLILNDSRRNGRIKQIHAEIVANPIKEGAHIVGFVLSHVNNSFFQGSKVPSPNATLSLVLITSDTTRIVVPLSKNFLT